MSDDCRHSTDHRCTRRRRGAVVSYVGHSGKAARWLWVGVAGCAMAAGCAKEGAPGGGPLDVYPPGITAHQPARDEVSVPRTATIEIEFSEDMERTSVENGLVVTPARSGTELRWEGKRLLVEGDPFPEDQTCVVTLLSTCFDEHGNALGEPYCWAFSTGDSLSTGLLRVGMESRGAPVVGGLALATLVGDTTRAPHRMGEADSTGNALLQWMEAGTFRVFAFRDANADLQYQFALEEMAEDTVEMSARDTVSVSLGLAVVDTIPPSLLRATALSSRQIDLVFNESVSGEGNYRVADERGDTLAVRLAYTDPEDRSLVHLALQRDMASVDYWVSASNLTDDAGLSLRANEAVFAGTSDPDVVLPAPRIVYVYAESVLVDEPQLWVQVRIVWTEAVGVPENTVAVRSVRTGRVQQGKQLATNPQETVLVLAEPLQLEEYATLSIPEGVKDLHGNVSVVALTTLLGPDPPEIPVVPLAGSYVPRGGP